MIYFFFKQRIWLGPNERVTNGETIVRIENMYIRHNDNVDITVKFSFIFYLDQVLFLR